MDGIYVSRDQLMELKRLKKLIVSGENIERNAELFDDAIGDMLKEKLCENNDDVIEQRVENRNDYDIYLTYHEEQEAAAQFLKKCLLDKHLRCFDAPDNDICGTPVLKRVEMMQKCSRVIVIASRALFEKATAVTQIEILQAVSQVANEDLLSCIVVPVDIFNKEFPDHILKFAELRTNALITKDDGTISEENINSVASAIVEWINDVEGPNMGLQKCNKIPAGNIHHGLAWGYYLGYLKFILNGMTNRIDDQLVQKIKTHEIKCATKNVLVCKLFIIVHCLGIPNEFSAVDPKINTVGKIKFSKDRAGNISRDFSNSIHSFTIEFESKEYTVYFVGEFPTPILTISDMLELKIAGLDRQQAILQSNKFIERLMMIVNGKFSPQLHESASNCLLLPFQEKAPKPLSGQIFDLVKRNSEYHYSFEI